MADTVTIATLQENDKRVVRSVVVQSDGSGGTSLLVDVSALTANSQGDTCTTVSLQRLWFSCSNGNGFDAYARIDQEDSDGDIPILGLTQAGYWDFREFGGIPANTTSNSNQYDVNLVVPGEADAGNMYTVVAEFIKNY
jgi:hypothetical protein|tara:strand:- start:49 stop:465 length:417 start_codon:yes stop_codon:yes gene_type:complete